MVHKMIDIGKKESLLGRFVRWIILLGVRYLVDKRGYNIITSFKVFNKEDTEVLFSTKKIMFIRDLETYKQLTKKYFTKLYKQECRIELNYVTRD